MIFRFDAKPLIEQYFLIKELEKFIDNKRIDLTAGERLRICSMITHDDEFDEYIEKKYQQEAKYISYIKKKLDNALSKRPYFHFININISNSFCDELTKLWEAYVCFTTHNIKKFIKRFPNHLNIKRLEFIKSFVDLKEANNASDTDSDDEYDEDICKDSCNCDMNDGIQNFIKYSLNTQMYSLLDKIISENMGRELEESNKII